MKLDEPVMEFEYDTTCRIIRRVNRFKVLVEVDGGREYAYINNTGRLGEFLVENHTAYCLWRQRPGKTRLRLFAVHDIMGLAALIDTRLQMESFEKLIENQRIPWLGNCVWVKRNPRLGGSILDYLLECNGEEIYVEVKSAVLRGDHKYAMYPDCQTLRGRRHIRELTTHVEGGGKGLIVFIAALPGVEAFKPYSEGDPEIPVLLRKAWEKGVPIKAINIYYDPDNGRVMLANPDLPVVL